MDTQLLLRKRLLNELTLSHQPHKAYWIEAPPGYGKSALLRTYQQHSDTLCIPYLFTRADQSATRLYNYLAKYIANEYQSDDLLVLLQNSLSYEPDPFSHEFASQFFQRLKKPVSLLFDDYHHVTGNDKVNQLLLSLIDTTPDHSRVIVASRQRPHPRFERLRFNREIATIDIEALLFTEKETADLLQNNHSKEMIDKIYRHSKGWIASTVMFAEGVSRGLSEDQCQREGCKAFESYYLAEIFPHIPTSTDIFRTLCTFSYFTPELASILCGLPIDDMQAILIELAERKFFVYQHKQSDDVFYLNQVIRKSLLATNRLILNKEKVLSAIDFSYEDLADMIVEQAELFISLDAEGALNEWIDVVPTDLFRHHIWLKYWRGKTLITKQPKKARILFSELYFELEQQRDTSSQLVLWAAIADSYMIELSEFKSAVVWIDKISELETRIDSYPSLECEAEVLTGLNGLFQWIPAFDFDIENLFKRTERTLYELSDPQLKLRLSCAYIRHLVIQGSYHRALSVLGIIRDSFNLKAVSPADNVLLHYSRVIGNYISGIDITDEHIALSDARQQARLRGMTVIDLSVRYLSILAYLNNGRVDVAKNKIPEAKNTLDIGFQLDQAHLEYTLGWIALLEYDYDTARYHELESYKYAMESSLVCTMYSLSHLCIIEIECKQFSKAQSYLAELRLLAFEKRVGIAQLHYHYASAYYELLSDNYDTALQCIQQTFKFCRENAIFDFSGKIVRVMTTLFEIAIENDIEPIFTKKMISYQKIKPVVFGNITSAWPHTIKISTLGHLEIEVGRNKLVGTKKPSKIELRLIKLLISNNGKPMDIPTIEEIIWPDQDSLTPGSNLKSTVSRVRRRLGEKDVILVKENQVYLNKELVWVDTWGLSHCISTLKNNKRVLSNLEYQRYCKAFAKLYEGDFYMDVDTELWLAQYQYTIQSEYAYFMTQAAHFFRLENPADEKNREMLNLCITKLEYIYSRIKRNLQLRGNHSSAQEKQGVIDKLLDELRTPSAI